MSKKRWKKGIRTSKLEDLFEKNFLMPLGIKYESQYYLKHKYYDFYIPSKKILIEVDGDYWHGNSKTNKSMNEMQKKNKINDMYKDRKAISSGFKILRFWESDIHNSPILVARKIKKALNI